MSRKATHADPVIDALRVVRDRDEATLKKANDDHTALIAKKKEIQAQIDALDAEIGHARNQAEESHLAFLRAHPLTARETTLLLSFDKRGRRNMGSLGPSMAALDLIAKRYISHHYRSNYDSAHLALTTEGEALVAKLRRAKASEGKAS